MRIALLQLKILRNKTANVLNTLSKIEETVKEHKPRVIMLPECFVYPYRRYAECIPDGNTSQLLSKAALDHRGVHSWRIDTRIG